MRILGSGTPRLNLYSLAGGFLELEGGLEGSWSTKAVAHLDFGYGLFLQ